MVASEKSDMTHPYQKLVSEMSAPTKLAPAIDTSDEVLEKETAFRVARSNIAACKKQSEKRSSVRRAPVKSAYAKSLVHMDHAEIFAPINVVSLQFASDMDVLSRTAPVKFASSRFDQVILQLFKCVFSRFALARFA